MVYLERFYSRASPWRPTASRMISWRSSSLMEASRSLMASLYGLSYTKFEYSDAGIMSETDDEYLIRVRLSNTGHADGTEIVQIYASYKDSRTVTPRFQLCGLGKCRIEAGGSVQTVIHVNKYWTSAVLDNGERVRPDGGIIFYVGGHQPDRRSCSLSGTECLEIRV